MPKSSGHGENMKFELTRKKKAAIVFGPLCGLLLLKLVGCAGTAGGPASYSVAGHDQSVTSTTTALVPAGGGNVSISPSVTTPTDAKGLTAYVPGPFVPAGGLPSGTQVGVLKFDSHLVHGDYPNASLILTNPATGASQTYPLKNSPALFNENGKTLLNLAFPNGPMSLQFANIKIGVNHAVEVDVLTLKGTVTSGVLPLPTRIFAILPKSNQELENASMQLHFDPALNGHTVSVQIVGAKASTITPAATIINGKVDFTTLGGNPNTILGRILSLTITVN